jgi:Flp pilus assembly protein TadB
MSAVVSAVLIGMALILLGPVTAKLNPFDPIAVRQSRLVAETALVVRLRVPLCGLAVAAGWAVFGGLAGLGIGVAAAVASWRALSKLESPAAVRRREELQRDLPTAVHLLGACLVAGAATDTALASVAEGMSGAVGTELALVRRRLQWATDPADVWRSIAGPLEPLGRTMARAYESGASVQVAIARLAADLRSETRSRADARARTVEVRAAAPLGLCFLPAFVLLGVVPMAAGLFSALSLFR